MALAASNGPWERLVLWLALLLLPLLLHVRHGQCGGGPMAPVPGALAPLPTPPAILAPPAAPYEPCRDKKPKDESHYSRYQQWEVDIVESCLYKQVAANAAGSFGPDGLVHMPPMEHRKQSVDNVTVDLRLLVVENLVAAPGMDSYATVHATGYIELNWTDPRLRWDQGRWPAKTLRIQSGHHIWTPRLGDAIRMDVSSRGPSHYGYFNYDRLVVTNPSAVRGTLSFTVRGQCAADNDHFPTVTYDCCFGVAPLEPHADLIHMRSEAMAAEVRQQLSNVGGSRWRFDKQIEGGVRVDSEGYWQLRFCTRSTRGYDGLRAQLQLPVLAAGALLLLSAAAGPIEWQLGVKLAALMLTVLGGALAFAAPLPPLYDLAVGGNRLPKIVRLYQFTSAMCLIGVLVSAVARLLLAGRRVLPPPNALARLAGHVHRLCAVCVLADASAYSTQQAELTAGNAGADYGATDGKYTHEWRQVWLALHALAITILSIIYLIGCFALI